MELRNIREQLDRRSGKLIHLADIVGGGNGKGTGKLGEGIDPATGKPQSAKRGVLEGAKPNVFAPSTVRFIDGVFIPAASEEGTQISSSGLRVRHVPRTSGQVWDAIRFGPVNSQFSTRHGDIDFASDGHSLLSLHANAGITFDLAALRETGLPSQLKFTAMVGYFGQTPKNGAGFAAYVDGELKQENNSLGRDDALVSIELTIPVDARFLTLMATDGGNGIGHDQICFADPWLVDAQAQEKSDTDKTEIAQLQTRRAEIADALASIPAPSRIYSVVAEATIPPINVLNRGDPELPGDEVAPAALACVASLSPELGSPQSTDADRRIAFANWVASPANPLTRRVIVNRVWHHHFGTGLVDTPSDFGLGGGLPSHPELLDWLADELLSNGWSLKSIHRLICTSNAYRQRSDTHDNPNSRRGRARDASNRLLWRMNPRRLDAESVRDAILAVSGKMNMTMFGPGYRDFEYQEEYAPVYRYITPDTPDLWRRSIYRFVVRTTTHQLLTTLDCPSPANLVPTRNVTTTALQSLALLNNDFVLKQSGYFADRLSKERPDHQGFQIERAFQLAFGRNPTETEAVAAVKLVESHGLTQLCRMLLNANEFVYVD